MENHRHGDLPGGAPGHAHGRDAGGRAHRRRNGAAPLHRAQQPVLVDQHERADGEPAGRHLPVRPLALRRLAEPRLGGGAPHHRHDPLSQHPRATPRQLEQLQKMPMDLSPPPPARPPTLGAPLVKPRIPADVEATATKVVIRDLRFYYKIYEALKGISLELYDKRVTAFIGPSGCGKSTLLRVLNRIYELYPDQRATGEVLIDGRNILDPGQDLN